MKKPLRTVVIVVVVATAAVAFHRTSGHVLHWLAAMHGGGQAFHGSR